MPSTEFMEFKTLADIHGHFEIALDLLLKKENFSHGVWPYKLYQPEASCQYESLASDVLSSTRKVTLSAVQMGPWF